MMTDEKKKSGSEIECNPPLVSDERREFLVKCGKFAVYTPPLIAALLLFDRKKAHAQSINGNGFGGSQPG
jgi:hypothetical protein